MRPFAALLAALLAAPTIATFTARPAWALSPQDLSTEPALPAGLAVPTDGRAFVLADHLRLRASPGTAAAVVVSLRIGTEVEVGDVREVAGRQWAQVSLVDRPSAFAIEGWVAADLLTELEPTLMALHHEILHAPTTAERALWVDRALELDPYSPIARDALANLRAEQESTAPPEPDMDLWLAVCDEGRMTLAAHIGESGRISKTWPAIDELGRLAGRAWYPAGDSRPLPGTPFPTPFLVGQHGEENRSPFAEGDYPMGDDDAGLPVLGACHDTGVLTSRPMREAPTSKWRGNFPDPRAGQLLWVESRALTDSGWAIHHLRVPYKMFDCGGEGEFIEAGIVMLTDASGTIGLAMGGPLPSEANQGATFATYTMPTWWNLGGDLLLGMTAGEEGTAAGVSLITLDRRSIRDVQHTTLRTWGC